TLEAALALRILGLRRHYASRVHIRDVRHHEGYRLLFGSEAEAASVTSRVRLCDEGETTRICYEVEAELDNTLMKYGAGILEKIARRMAARFFNRLNEYLREED